jgi:dolichyl-phosphate-mannose-protein mannosyltransferase
MGGIYPMFGWGLHYLPFVIMSRVTYVHHYVPALYFAMMVLVYEIDALVRCMNKPSSSVIQKISYVVIYAALYFGVAGTFWYLRYFSFGMDGAKENWAHLQLVDSWRVSDDNYK